MWKWGLFSHIQLIGTNVQLPKTDNVPPEIDFQSSRSPAKSECWNSRSLHCLAVLSTYQYCLYSQVWLNVRCQSIQAFVTSFGPFCNRLCKFIHWPENIWSSNTCQMQAFQSNLKAHLWQFSNRCHFFFEMVVIDAWSRYCVELLNRLVWKLTISFHTSFAWASISEDHEAKQKISGVWKFFSSPRGNSRFEHGL